MSFNIILEPDEEQELIFNHLGKSVKYNYN